jgi:N-acetylneuraminic acid mutarotase
MLVAGPVNGKAYIFANDYTSGPMTLEYDPTTDSWATKAPIPIPIGTFLYGYVAGSDGKIYAIGRLPDPSNPSAYSSTVRVFDPAQNTWSVAAPLPSTSNWPSVAATSDGRIYAFDEGVVSVYTISTNSWTTTSSNAVIYGQMGAVQAGNGKIYLVGGPILASNLGFPLKLVTVYDPKTNTWEQQTELPRGAQGPSLVALNGDDLYVIGGWAGSSWNDSVQEAKIP